MPIEVLRVNKHKRHIIWIQCLGKRGILKNKNIEGNPRILETIILEAFSWERGINKEKALEGAYVLLLGWGREGRNPGEVGLASFIFQRKKKSGMAHGIWDRRVNRGDFGENIFRGFNYSTDAVVPCIVCGRRPLLWRYITFFLSLNENHKKGVHRRIGLIGIPFSSNIHSH